MRVVKGADFDSGLSRIVTPRAVRRMLVGTAVVLLVGGLMIVSPLGKEMQAAVTEWLWSQPAPPLDWN